MIIDRNKFILTRNGVVWTPTRNQWLIVENMSRRIGWMFTRQQLLDLIVSSSDDPRCIDTHIKRIRIAFEDRKWDDPIETRYNMGYVWRTPVVNLEALIGSDEFTFRRSPE